ncbi:hypothetical protein VUS43_04885, partial [Pseudomonas aeruginosa]
WVKFQSAGWVNFPSAPTHISHVRSQITALQALEQQLVSLRASCNEGREINACGILTGISEESKQQLYRASSGRKD